MTGFDDCNGGARLSSPATQRNREPILEVLGEVLPNDGTVLEIASGSGEHAFYFSYHLPQVTWYPSDANAAARASITAWRNKGGPPNLCAPLALDVTRKPWPRVDFDALVCINMLHIAPWEAAQALFDGAKRLPVDGVLYLYGPFKREGSHTAPSNASFDADLRRRDARWGIRDLEAVVALGESHGLALARIVEMPANNLSLVFKPDIQR
ncbi:MAG TPA: DUF938 domain-containing protein [Modicisalibacter sp.]|nr:DUF938 domain-containing protein [Modicisalibacter sp.]